MKGTDTEASGSDSNRSGFSVRRGIGYFLAFLLSVRRTIGHFLAFLLSVRTGIGHFLAFLLSVRRTIGHFLALHPRVRRGIGYFLAFLLTLGLIDAFGVKKSVAFGSATLFNRYFANAYPHCIRDFKCILWWSDPKQRDPQPESKDVSVVLWNDSTLDRSDMVWPLRMEAHAHVLETILAYEPKAVMVDIFFLDDPAQRGDDSLDALLDVVEEYAESDVDLYFLEPAGTRTIPALREAAGDSNILPATFSHSPSSAYLGDSAASRVYRRTHGANGPEIADFYLFWGGRSDPVTKKFFWGCKTTYSRDSGADVFPENILEVGRAVVPGVFKSASQSEPYCPYTPTMPADVLHCLPPTNEVTTDRAKECMASVGARADVDDVKYVLARNYVIYGAQFSGMGDVIKTPVSGDHILGGVYAHATALDNLVSTGGSVQFKKGRLSVLPGDESPPKWLTWETVHYYVITALVATGSFFVVGWALFNLWPRMERYLVCRFLSHKRSRWKPLILVVDFLYYAFVVGVVGAFLLFLTWAIYLFSAIYPPVRFGVLNWTGILLASGVLSVWAKKSLAEGLGNLVGRLFGSRGTG